MPDPRPNVLFLLSDQHNPAVTGCYGDVVVRTPNLDRLAAGGTVLDNLYCASPLCTPSRMSMLTGRHPFQNEVWSNEHILSSAAPTYAHALGAVGYHPHLIGKLHARGPDQLHGFGSRELGDHGPAYVGAAEMARGRFEGTAGPNRISVRRSGSGHSAYDYRDARAAIAAAAYLDEYGAKCRAGIPVAPFALTVGFLLPHPPYVALDPEFDYYAGKVPPPTIGAEGSPNGFQAWWRADRDAVDLAEEDVMRARAAYWALVDRLDQLIGQVLDALSRNDLDRNTLVIYSSDHGDHLGEHGLFWKHTFHDSSAKVPGILRWPGVIPSGNRCARVVSALDITATMLDAAGAPALPASPGRSLLPLLRDTTAEWDDVAFCEGGIVYHRLPQRMVRSGDWKLCYYHDWPLQLFNVAEDPNETRDLAGDERYASVLEELSNLIFAGWDPNSVQHRLDLLHSEAEVLAAWYRTIRPEETYRWDLPPECTWLDDDAEVLT